ncbi:MAG: hypothetical protein AAF298_20360 [Cyanobacteria bacterium P01_A01_bin.40]
MFEFAVHSSSFLKPLLLQLRIVGACSVLGLCTWSLTSFVFEAIAQAKRMHQIPCTRCQFFTGDYRLKCTVNPSVANTEAAIGCGDYRCSSLK